MHKQFMCLKAVVWLVCIYHVTLGIVLNAPVGLISSTLTHFLGATKCRMLQPCSRHECWVLICLCLASAWGLPRNPIKNRALLTVGVILVSGRALQRLLQADDLNQALGVSSSTNWATIAVLMVFACAMAFFRFKLWRKLRAEENV